jgi:hypothetical protein
MNHCRKLRRILVRIQGAHIGNAKDEPKDKQEQGIVCFPVPYFFSINMKN